MDLETLAPNRKYPMSTKKWYVYTLEYPDGTVFYVGKGTGPRVHAHELNALWALRASKSTRECHYLDNARNATIHKIWGQGQHIKKSIIFESDSEEEAFIYEWGMIYAMCYSVNLTNGMRSNSGVGSYRYLPKKQGIYRVWAKDERGNYKRKDVTPIK